MISYKDNSIFIKGILFSYSESVCLTCRRGRKGCYNYLKFLKPWTVVKKNHSTSCFTGLKKWWNRFQIVFVYWQFHFRSTTLYAEQFLFVRVKGISFTASRNSTLDPRAIFLSAAFWRRNIALVNIFNILFRLGSLLES